jgi:hypothetical protein
VVCPFCGEREVLVGCGVPDHKHSRNSGECHGKVYAHLVNPEISCPRNAGMSMLAGLGRVA